jgi:signal transduction histidine kinase
VWSNYDRIEQLLVILLDNAYKFTPDGGEISILLEQVKNKVNVVVQDNGVGIDEEDLPFIFDRFYKCDKSRSHKGTGLGLSIAREITSLMGEKIFVQSNCETGSSFTFTLEVFE